PAEGARAALQAARPAHQAARRGESDPGEVGGGADGVDRHGHTPAAHAALAAIPRNRPGGDAPGGRQAGWRPARRRGQDRMTRRSTALALALALALGGCGGIESATV